MEECDLGEVEEVHLSKLVADCYRMPTGDNKLKNLKKTMFEEVWESSEIEKDDFELIEPVLPRKI